MHSSECCHCVYDLDLLPKSRRHYSKISYFTILSMYYILGASQKYREVFETQNAGNKTSSGEICLSIRTLASPKVGQNQVSAGVSILCWHAAPFANVLWESLAIRKKSNSVLRSGSVTESNIGVMFSEWRLILYMVIFQNVVWHLGEANLILVKIAYYSLLYWWMNSCNFKSKQLHKEWQWDGKFGKSLILA